MMMRMGGIDGPPLPALRRAECALGNSRPTSTYDANRESDLLEAMLGAEQVATAN